jgi:uncharacterized membrane protein
MSRATTRDMANDHVRSRLVGPNVPAVERIASVTFGLALAAFGIRRRSLVGAAIAGLGSALVARGVTGRSALYRMRAVRKGIEVRRAITVQAHPLEIYDLWRTFTDEWGVELVEDSPGRRLRWRVPHGADRHEGQLDLRDGDRGTVVDVRLHFHPRGGLFVAGTVGGVLRDKKGLRLATELARLRMWLETGELATGDSHPAQASAL